MGKMLITALTGLALSAGGYYALHTVDLSPSTSPTDAEPASSPILQTSLPAPSTRKSPPIRVCLTGRPVASVKLQIDGPFRLQTLSGKKVLHSGQSMKECRAKFAGQALHLGGHSYRATRLEIVPENSPAIWVNDHQYHGKIRLDRQPRGKLLAVNVLPLEDYIASVVDSEMPAAFPQAARRAQAVCSRTYALYQMAQSRSHPYFDVYSTTRSQKYLGYQYRKNGKRLAGETAAGRKIARETAGLACLHEGKLFCTYYSAVCGGRTTPGKLVFRDAAPPLQAVSCNWCREARYFRWTEKRTFRSATQRLSPVLGSSESLLSSISRADNQPLTPASVFRASNGKKRVKLSAVELRRRLSLPSTTFQVWRDSEHFLFEGRGHGHGVGLCQWGARGLALAGKSAREILRYYYPGCRIAAVP